MRGVVLSVSLLLPSVAQATVLQCSFQSICRGDAPCLNGQNLRAQLEVIDDLAELTFDDQLRITGPMHASGAQFTSTMQSDDGQTAVILSRRPDGTAAMTVHALTTGLVVETMLGQCEPLQ